MRRPPNRSRLRLLAAAAALILLSLVACEASAQDTDTGPAGTSSGKEAQLPALGAPPFPTGGNGFDPTDFGPDSAEIDNRYLPFVPGTQLVYVGSSIGEGERLPRKVVTTVTDLTKVIAGVRAVVAWDRDFTDGELEESELSFFAQDREGKVWHLGEYAEIYDGEQFDGAAPWLVGYLEGAKAGILMQADPRPGELAYSQGFAPPPYFWDDHARVVDIGRSVCVPAGCFDDVLVTEEFEPSKPGAFQLKFYAPDVGDVRVGWRGVNEEEREVLVLTSLRHLGADAMQAVREEAIAMDARGSVYGLTAPIAQRS